MYSKRSEIAQSCTTQSSRSCLELCEKKSARATWRHKPCWFLVGGILPQSGNFLGLGFRAQGFRVQGFRV